MKLDEKEIGIQKGCFSFYLPPIELLTHWLKFPKPATLIKHYGEFEGIEPPMLPHDTFNNVLDIHSSASLLPVKKLETWHKYAFNIQLGANFNSPALKGHGYIGSGAVSWVSNLEQLKSYCGDDFSYTLGVVEALINAEKEALNDVLDSELSAADRIHQIYYENPKVKLLYEGLSFQAVSDDNNALFAKLDGRSTTLLIATCFLYFIASWDVEYSLQINSRNAEINILRSVIPTSYQKNEIHLAFWEELRQHAIHRGKITGTWDEIANKLHNVSTPDNALHTLNCYKMGQVEISTEDLAILINNIFGESSERLYTTYSLRSKATWFLSRMFDEMKKEEPNLKDADIKCLLDKYHQYFEYHLVTLKEVSL